MNFQGSFELFDISVRRLRNGHKLRLIFECEEDIETEKQLIELRGKNVQVDIQGNGKNIESMYEVFDVKCRRLRNGNKLCFILEQMYDKANELEIVNLRYNECEIGLTILQDELGFEE